MAAADFLAILRTLLRFETRFIVVGGVSAVLQGAPVNTLFDLDIVHARDAANLTRLLAALREMDAAYRMRPGLAPELSHIASPVHQLLTTKFGPLDVLGSIGSGLNYDDLLAHTDPMQVGEGLRVPVLKLEMLVALKEELGAEKDLAVLPVLRRTLRERRLS